MDLMTYIFGPDAEKLPPLEAARRSTMRFVRGEGGLAEYKEHRNAIGHQLTAWETYSSFGLDVIDEALEYSSAILKASRTSTSDALRERRRLLGLPIESVEKAARVSRADIETAETTARKVGPQELLRIAFVLGLDERYLAFKREPGGDSNLAYRLRTLQEERNGSANVLSHDTAMLFAETASIIRVQHRLQDWLGLRKGFGFVPHAHNFGTPEPPPWKIGYIMAERARNTLHLGDAPIASMRKLAERRLGIPVIQARLPDHIAGATVMTTSDEGGEARGVVLNTVGENENVWIRRTTLTRELAHLLYDLNTSLDNLRLDSYSDVQFDPEGDGVSDFEEQRANAFAIAFLAPNDAVREAAPAPVTEEGVAKVMHKFGISQTAARNHITNCHDGRPYVPSIVIRTQPSDEQTTAENGKIDYFPLPDTPIQRRGRFAGLVASAYLENLISDHTAALYLDCGIADFREHAETLKAMYLN